MCKLSVIAIIFLLSLHSSLQKNVTTEVFGSLYKNGLPIAFGDFNRDHLTDVISLSKNYSSFEILFGSVEFPFIQIKPGFRCNLSWKNNETNIKIVGFSMADFTGDGNIDFLVSFVVPNIQNATIVTIIRGNSQDELRCSDIIKLNGSSNYLILSQEPLILDVNGDMIADLLGETIDFERKFWIFGVNEDEDNHSPISIDFPCSQHEQTSNSNNKCQPFANPHSNSFVDIDGDFSPELILVSNEKSNKTDLNYRLEVYSIEDVSNLKSPILSVQKWIDLNGGHYTINALGSSLFMDIALNGVIVQVIPYCRKKNCIKSSGFLLVENGHVKTLDVTFQDGGGRDWSFIPPSDFSVYSKSITLQVSDLNLDGYPDLLGILKHESFTSPVLFLNVPCIQKYCKYPRTFELDFNTLSKYNQSISAAFFEGLDIMITLGESPNYVVEMYRKTYSFDAYFIKWMMSTGICTGGPCQAFVPAPGCSMKYNITTNHGKLQTGSAVQFYRSSHFPLDLPYTLVGVGVSANFIEHILFGKSESKNAIRFQEWQQIIPNSQLIVIPSPFNKPKEWKLKNYLTPSESGLMNTLRVLLLIFIFLVSVVIVLWFREIKEDKIIRRSRPENNINML